MRPKVVILTLVVAFGLLGIVAVFKGMTGAGHTEGEQPPRAGTDVATQPTTNSNQGNPVTIDAGKAAAISEEMRANEVRKEVDAIRELQSEADGTNNPMIIAALIGKVTHPEAEVRMTALDALKQLNDTNAVSALQQAEEQLKDPREKVAVLDVIDYLKLPDIMPAVQPPETLTNYSDTTPTPKNLKMNPNFVHKSKNAGGAGTNGQ